MSVTGEPVSTITTQDAEPIYRHLLDQISTIITTTGGITAPFEEPSRSTVFCTQERNAQAFGYTAANSDPIPDDAWPTALDQVTTLLEGEGFTDVLTMHDEPGHHVVYFRRPDGAGVRLGTQNASSVGLDTACHPLPARSTGAP